MKRIAFSLFSTLLLFAAVAPLAQASSSTLLSQAPPVDVERPQQSPSGIEQQRQDRLDRQPSQGDLNRPPAEALPDTENPRGTPTALEQRRLDELNRQGDQNGSLDRSPAGIQADMEPAGSVQTSHIQRLRLEHLNSPSR